MYWVVASNLTNRISASNVRFRAGSSIRGSGGTLHQASQLIAHPSYDAWTDDFDVAVASVCDNVFTKLNFGQNRFKRVQTRLMMQEIWFTI
jgi:hypothetical protein